MKFTDASVFVVEPRAWSFRECRMRRDMFDGAAVAAGEARASLDDAA